MFSDGIFEGTILDFVIFTEPVDINMLYSKISHYLKKKRVKLHSESFK